MRLVLALSLALLAPAVAAQSAVLNPSFDGDGIASPDLGGTSSALDALILGDGSVILGGDIGSIGGVSKLNADGTLDTSFGTNGTVTFPFGGRTTYVADVDPNGNDVIAVGSGSNSAGTDTGFGFVARMATDGSFVTSFGSNGIVQINEGPGYSRPGVVDAEVLADGDILVAASGRDPNLDQIIVLVRLNADGSRDTGYGTNGVSIVNGLVLISDMQVLNDGRVVLSGYLPTSTDGTEAEAALLGITAAGALDTSFGTGGAARLNLGAPFSRFLGMDLDSQGRIVVAGISGDSDTEGVVARFTSAGVLDASFDTDGLVRLGGTDSRASDVLVLSDDRVVAFGTENATSALVAQFTAAGVPDVLFDTDGTATFPLSPNGVGIAGERYDDGDLLVAGYVYENGDRDQSNAVALRVTSTSVDSERSPEAASALRLAAAGANPARDVQVALSLAEGASVRLDLYDVRGRHAGTLYDGSLAAGRHAFAAPAGLAPGTYIVRAVSRDGDADSLPVVVLR